MRREEETKRTTEARQEEVVSMKDVRQEYVDNPTMLLVAARLNAAMTKAAIANVKEANESRHLLDFGQVAEEVTLYAQSKVNEYLNAISAKLDDEIYNHIYMVENFNHDNAEEELVKLEQHADVIVAMVREAAARAIDDMEEYCKDLGTPAEADGSDDLVYSYYINDDTLEEARRELKNLLGWMFVSHVWYYTEIALDEIRSVLTQTYLGELERRVGAQAPALCERRERHVTVK